MLKDLNKDDFEAILENSAKPVVLDFWAPWCGPCRGAAPVIKAFAEANRERFDFYKVNIDECRDIAADFEIRSIPAIVMLRGSEVLGQLVGDITEETLNELAHKVE